MKRVWVALEKLLHPPIWVLLGLPPVVFAILAYVLRTGIGGIPAYLIYGMSAYCLILWVLPLPQLFWQTKACVIRKMNATRLVRHFLNDLAFRGSVSLFSAMVVNFLYVVFRIFVGIRFASVWFISIAVYYLVLGLIRLSLIMSYRKRSIESEWRCYRRTAWELFALNIPMGGMILLMVLTDSRYSYPGYVIYLSALYTFYTVILSVVNLVRFRKLGSPILSAAKVLNFVAALMSLLCLQTAMIAQFSDGEGRFRVTMNAATGGIIWLAVIVTAIYMLFHSRKMKEVKSCEPFRK